MPIDRSEWIYYSGEWKRWEDATVHVTAHALHYGSAAFEGIRCYSGKEGSAIFRLDRHNQRLLDSCHLLRMDMGEYDLERLNQICIDLVARNEHDACYIRPIIFRGVESMGLYPLDCPVEVCVFSFAWGRYLGPEAIEKGVDVMVSSWRRYAPGTTVPLGKISGQYVPNQFVSIEARSNGFAEGLMLDAAGFVSEGAGENIFLVRHGEIITPPISSSILEGVTRDSVITLARDLGFTVRFESISRELLYICDELFMVGTAAEITPVRSVDRVQVGKGRRGPVTEQLQSEFFALVEGEKPDRHGWLTQVPRLQAVSAADGE